jgi:hypothetical protein
VKKGNRWPEPETREKAFVDPCEKAIYPKYLAIREGGCIQEGAAPGPYLMSVFGLNERSGVRRMLMLRELRTMLSDAVKSKDLVRALNLVTALENELST